MRRLRGLIVAAVGAACMVGGYKVFEVTPASNVVLFVVVRFRLIPVPLPIGFMKTPHFWAGVLVLLGCFLVYGGMRTVVRQ